MTQIRLHLEGISDLDLSDPKVRKKRQIIPKPQKQSDLERGMLESGLRVYSKLDQPSSKLVGACLDFKSDPKSTITTIGTLKHARLPPAVGRTIALGPSLSAGGAALIGISGGVFFSPTPRATPIGLYGSIDVGVVMNFTASVAVQLMYYLLPPEKVFTGPPTICAGISVSTPGLKIAGGGAFAIFFERLPGPPEFIGVGLQLVLAGAGVLPVDLFLTKSFGTSTI
jgi:hypothetical protein